MAPLAPPGSATDYQLFLLIVLSYSLIFSVQKILNKHKDTWPVMPDNQRPIKIETPQQDQQPNGTAEPITDPGTNDPVSTPDPVSVPVPDSDSVSIPDPVPVHAPVPDPEDENDVQSGGEEKRKNVAQDKSEQNTRDGLDCEDVRPLEDLANPRRNILNTRKENESNEEQGACSPRQTLDSGIGSGNEYSSSQDVTEVCTCR